VKVDGSPPFSDGGFLHGEGEGNGNGEGGGTAPQLEWGVHRAEVGSTRYFLPSSSLPFPFLLLSFLPSFLPSPSFALLQCHPPLPFFLCILQGGSRVGVGVGVGCAAERKQGEQRVRPV
jgi:hypothetical protein